MNGSEEKFWIFHYENNNRIVWTIFYEFQRCVLGCVTRGIKIIKYKNMFSLVWRKCHITGNGSNGFYGKLLVFFGDAIIKNILQIFRKNILKRHDFLSKKP